MPSNRTELRSLKRLIAEADVLVDVPGLPEDHTVRCHDVLRSALALADDLLNQTEVPAAALLGRKGDTVTAKRGSDYFRKLAPRRSTFGGGRPRKSTE
jgi:hypothetical protein